jgi:small subunit ribosomal protein S16
LINRQAAIESCVAPQKSSNPGLPIARSRTILWPLFGQSRKAHGSIGTGRPTIYEDFIMAVKIRMKRVGAKNAPVFRIVVADGRSPRDGKFIEEIGTYQPRKKGDNYTLKLDRAKYWLSKGAQPSDTVASFIKKSSKAAAAVAA